MYACESSLIVDGRSMVVLHEHCGLVVALLIVVNMLDLIAGDDDDGPGDHTAVFSSVLNPVVWSRYRACFAYELDSVYLLSALGDHEPACYDLYVHPNGMCNVDGMRYGANSFEMTMS